MLKPSASLFVTHMKSALNLGFWVLLCDVPQQMDSTLDPVLLKQTFENANGQMLIRFADTDIDYNKEFKLFMTTKMPNPAYLPDVFIKTSVVNFTVTMDGLEDQLLAYVVKNEQAEIERTRDELVVNLAQYKRKIIEAEKAILVLLDESKTQGKNLVDDTVLITTLEVSKNTSKDVEEKIEQSTVLEKSIEQTRNQYREVSTRGAVLYFIIKDLSLIDPMYQYSLQYIIKLFCFAMGAAESGGNIQERLLFLISKIT